MRTGIVIQPDDISPEERLLDARLPGLFYCELRARPDGHKCGSILEDTRLPNDEERARGALIVWVRSTMAGECFIYANGRHQWTSAPYRVLVDNCDTWDYWLRGGFEEYPPP